MGDLQIAERYARAHQEKDWAALRPLAEEGRQEAEVAMSSLAELRRHNDSMIERQSQMFEELVVAGRLVQARAGEGQAGKETGD